MISDDGADVARWRAARTLADLGELTAQWLEGGIASGPWYGGRSEDETTPLIPVLAAANRAGFVTDFSQPGELLDKDGSAQRAAVGGFTTTATLAALLAYLEGTGVTVLAHAGASQETTFDVQMAVSLDDDAACTWAGGCLGRLEFESYADYCGHEVLAALAGAWQVSLVDPEWGRNTVLWPALGAFTATVMNDSWSGCRHE